jgi:hypothetical protein
LRPFRWGKHTYLVFELYSKFGKNFTQRNLQVATVILTHDDFSKTVQTDSPVRLLADAPPTKWDAKAWYRLRKIGPLTDSSFPLNIKLDNTVDKTRTNISSSEKLSTAEVIHVPKYIRVTRNIIRQFCNDTVPTALHTAAHRFRDLLQLTKLICSLYWNCIFQ